MKGTFDATFAWGPGNDPTVFHGQFFVCRWSNAGKIE